MFSNPVFADFKRNGDATKIWASTTAIVPPGTVNPKPFNMGPNSPLGAKAKSKATPATAGGSTMGKSIRVSRIVFPGNFLVTIKYAVGTVKSRAVIVAMADVNKLSFMGSTIWGFCSCVLAKLGLTLKKTARIGIAMKSKYVNSMRLRMTTTILFEIEFDRFSFNDFCTVKVVQKG
jgi:hypothetical protein